MSNFISYSGLDLLKVVVEETYANIISDGRYELKAAIDRLFPKPLFVFVDSYEDFMKYVTGDSDIFDRWINTQMQVMTALGEESNVFTKLMTLYTTTFNTSIGEGKLVIETDYHENQSFLIALSFRVYLDSLVARSKDE